MENDNSKRLLYGLMGLGFTLTTATQFRLSSLPIGPGEFLLIICSSVIIISCYFNKKYFICRLGLPFLYFWIYSLIIISIGYLYASYIFKNNINPTHDFIAYLFVFFLLVIFFLNVEIDKVFFSLSMVITTTVFFMSILYLFPNKIQQILDISPWYYTRFRGWSENPNQLALLLSPTPFFLVYLKRQTFSKIFKVFYFLSIIIIVLIGMATKSDALIIGWLISFLLFLIGEYFFKGNITNKYMIFINIFKIMFFIVIIIGVGYFIRGNMYDQIENKAKIIYYEGKQGSVRFLLWENGIKAIKISPYFGLGPGGHSGINAPFSGEESHNSIIDWGASTGLLGLIGCIWLNGWIIICILRSKNTPLIGAFGGLIFFSLFHYTFRHPIFWFYISSIILLAKYNLQNNYKKLKLDVC